MVGASDLFLGSRVAKKASAFSKSSLEGSLRETLTSSSCRREDAASRRR